MNSQTSSLKIWLPLRLVVGLAGLIDLAVGFVFIISPEIGFTLWPSPVSSTLSRFIGAIILANGVGASMVAWNGGWEHARVLFTVALLYGLIIMVTLPFDLLMYQKDTILWGYVAVTSVFFFPIVIIFVVHEFLRWRNRPVSK